MLLTRTSAPENMLSTAEASNLWDILKSHYMALELLQIWGNYAHDPEFKGLIISYSKDLEKNIHLLEGEAKKQDFPDLTKTEAPSVRLLTPRPCSTSTWRRNSLFLPKKTWNSC